ncbi:class I SAM-dependent methyltransferase [Brevibacillus sp. B_LB10_24]|uniref:class I SAM-dependent methyltransferase n=1 Tax=Brevibacillus sp. B_LB10_24 TaxID=3380645 RepID=UPI0038BC3552
MAEWFARFYDMVMDPLERRGMRGIREELVSKATGAVLEIGSGTGLNFPHYKHAEEVIAIEPNPRMRSKSMNRRRESRVPIQVIDGGAENLPFADNTFDTAVATLVFCTIPDPERAFQEIRRVCKPDAKILLFEHVRLDHPVIGKIQDWVTPLWKRVCDGCELNRKTVELLQREGFKVIRTQTHYRGLFVTLEAGNSKTC